MLARNRDKKKQDKQQDMMPPRSQLADKCTRCRIYRPLCLCSDIVPLILDTRVTLYMHWRERLRATNTGWLACLALPNSEIRLRGGPSQQLCPAEAAPLKNAILLFPSPDAVELTPEWLARQPRPVTLVVADGSWRQAKKVPYRESGLAGIPNVKLPVGAPSCYRLRRSPHLWTLSTLEAIARAMGLIEGREVQVALESLFLKMVERRLWSMGRLRPEECVTVIPEEAILTSRRAGAAGGRKKNQVSHRDNRP
jgi:DTW domain-containing protein YfiP